MTEPTLPVSQPATVIKFWDGQKFRFCPKCQRLAFDFADAYATYVTAERDRELQQAREEINKWATAGGKQFKRAESAETSLSEAREELAQLNSILNTPETEDFDKAVPLEASHQVLRWGADHDAGKNPEDWFWLVGYLAGKALSAFKAGDLTKAKHHTISTSAALRNWHAHIRSGESRMRPGLSGDKTAPFEAVPEKPDHHE